MVVLGVRPAWTSPAWARLLLGAPTETVPEAAAAAGPVTFTWQGWDFGAPATALREVVTFAAALAAAPVVELQSHTRNENPHIS